MVQRIAPRFGLAAALALSALTHLAAQAQIPDPRNLVIVDRVVATVNDTVILYSELNTLASSELRVAETTKGSKLTDAERAFIINRNLQELINRAALSQAAKTLGVLPPDRVEDLLKGMLKDDEDQQIRDFGSMTAFSRALSESNRTWETWQREQRQSKLADLTKQIAVYGRLQNQRGLFITPKMMRQYLARNQKAIEDQRAIVAIVGFSGPSAKEAAEQAAAAWRNEPLSPAELAKRFDARGAVDLGVLVLSQESRKDRPKDLVDFALAGPINQVQVVDKSGIQQVWKVTDYAGGKKQSFDDPLVQADIRRNLEQQVVQYLTRETIRRARERTEPWMPIQDMMQATAPGK